jgi:hypothetical protein
MYLDARDSQELLSSLEQTLQVEYEIIDETGEIRARGIVGGDPIRIMEGTYTLRVLLDPEPLDKTVTVKSGQKTRMELKKDNDRWTLIKKR